MAARRAVPDGLPVSLLYRPQGAQRYESGSRDDERSADCFERRQRALACCCRVGHCAEMMLATTDLSWARCCQMKGGSLCFFLSS